MDGTPRMQASAGDPGNWDSIDGMTRTSLAYAVPLLVVASFASPALVSAQATCVDGTGDMCLNVLRLARADGVVDDIFQTRDGLYGPQLGFARYMRGVNGCIGVSSNRLIYEGYVCGAPGSGPPGGDDPAFQANSLDWYWTQILRTRDDGSTVADGEPGFYIPWRGRIMDIGGEANRVVLFPITDHPPLPCEAFEYTVWLSNNPDATTIAPESAPDPMQWNPARLIRAFTQGWTRNATSEGAVDATRADLGTYLRDASGGDAIADALATVWSLPCGLSFRYVAIQGGNNGNPGPECAFHSQEDELDAVAGLNEDDTAICLDMDMDGHRAATCGGDDCDDADAAVHPGAFEPCDSARDLDCMPPVECPSGTMCDTESGLCATACFEGACAAGFTCTASGLCTEAACAARTEPCPDGTICRAGACVDPCDGVVCPGRLACIGGACIDLCLGVICPSMQVCVADRPGAVTLCGPACTCTDIAATSLCPAGTTCDPRAGSGTMGLCVDPGCESLTCGPGEVCTAGACVDGCLGVTCPLGQTCRLAECVIDRCASVTCGGGQVCREGTCFDACDTVMCTTGMRCRNGACEPDPCAGVDCGPGNRCVEGSCVPDGTTDAGSSAFDAGVRPDSGRSGGIVTRPGCGCRVGADASSSATLALLTLIVLALVVRRRR